jgi:hypothetical protein
VRAQDIREQTEYAMTSPRGEIRVTVLAVNEPVGGRPARIRVRAEQGVSKGREFEVTSRRILARWGEPTPTAPIREPVAALITEVSRPPCSGDLVHRSKTGPVEWTVDEVDIEAETVRISAILIGTKQSYTGISFDELEPVEQEIAIDPLITERDDATSEPEPAAEVIELDLDGHRQDLLEHEDALGAIVDRLLFSDKCLRFCRRRFAPKVAKARTAEHLRARLLKEGQLRSWRRSRHCSVQAPPEHRARCPSSGSAH